MVGGSVEEVSITTASQTQADSACITGFCHNCLWYKANGDLGIELSQNQVREQIYGMPYADWKAQCQKEASTEQLAVFNQGNPH